MASNRTKAPARKSAQAGARAEGGLTQKQEAFCLAFIETGNGSEAYRTAYKVRRATAKTVNEMASKLLADPKVTARVAALRETAASKAVFGLVEHLAELATLRDLAKLEKAWGPAVQAEVKRGEAAGLYPDRSRSVNVHVGLPSSSEPVSETAQWVGEITGRKMGAQP